MKHGAGSREHGAVGAREQVVGRGAQGIVEHRALTSFPVCQFRILDEEPGMSVMTQCAQNPPCALNVSMSNSIKVYMFAAATKQSVGDEV